MEVSDNALEYIRQNVCYNCGWELKSCNVCNTCAFKNLESMKKYIISFNKEDEE
jgi:hypothetical protein